MRLIRVWRNRVRKVTDKAAERMAGADRRPGARPRRRLAARLAGVGAVLLLLGGCGPSPGGPVGGTADLAWALAHAPIVEWHVLSEELRDHPAVEAQWQRLQEIETLQWVRVEPTGAGSNQRARLVIGLADAPECAAWLDRMGVQRDEQGWLLGGVRTPQASAGLIATLRDPDRPRFPLTFACATQVENLVLLLETLEPGTYPCAQLMHGEWAQVRVDLDDRGQPIPERTVACAPWFRQPGLREQGESYASAAYPIRAYAGTDRATVEAYATSLRKAWNRAEEWAGPLGPDYVRLFAQGQALLWKHNGLPGRWSRADRASDSAQVLLPAGFQADGGAGILEAYLTSALGPSSWPWMADACALQASQVYEGMALEDWWAVLASLTDIGRPSEWLLADDWSQRSPHLVRPLRALLVQLVWEEDPQNLRKLWKAPAGDPLWQRAFDRVPERLGSFVARSRPHENPAWPTQRPMLGVAFGGGFDLDGAGPWSAGHQAWMDELHTKGVRAMGLPLVCVAQPLGPWSRRLPWGQPDHRFGLQGETLLAASLHHAHRLGWSTGVELEVWARPSGVPLQDLVWPDTARTEEFFTTYGRSAMHAALFARLHGVTLLNLGNRMGEMVRTQAKDEEASLAAREPVFRARQQGWRRMWAPVREVFSGSVGMGAGNAGWLDQSPVLQELEYTTLQATVTLRQLAPPTSSKAELAIRRWRGWFDLWERSTGELPAVLWPLGPAPPEPSVQGSPEIGVPSYAQRTKNAWQALGKALRSPGYAESWPNQWGVFLGPVPFDGEAPAAAGQSLLSARELRWILE